VEISVAATRAARSTSAGSHEQAMPSWVGNTVAPGQNAWPWMQSSAMSSGMRSRVVSTMAIASRMRAGEACSSEPAVRVSTASARSSRASSCSICPTFSVRLIRRTRSSTRSPIGRAAS